MTFVVELRDLKKFLPRPSSHLWQRAIGALCVVRVRLALLGLLGFALVCPVDAPLGLRAGALASLCSVLSAAVAATLGLLRDACIGLSALFSDDSSPLFRLEQRSSLCFGEPMFPFDICPEAGPFPALSWHFALVLLICALLLFGCGIRRPESPRYGRER
ncbi:MAG TPA: hypothetical protein VGJ91_19595 [Polyangiaceae bacterium]|jgi:hypothetical protein